MGHIAGKAEGRELETMPMGRLFAKYSLISLLGMAAQIAMVVIEGVIIGYGLGAHGLACVSLIISVELINLAVGGALGAGVSATVGARLGSGDTDGARRAFGQGLWLTVCTSVSLAVLLELFAPWLVCALGATEDIYADSLGGIRWFVAFFPLTITGQVACAVLRVDGRPQLAARYQVISSAVAIGYLAVAVLVLRWGVLGAGVYFGLTISLWALGLGHFLPGGGSSLRIRKEDLHMDGALVLDVLKVGLPYFALQAAGAAYTALVNNRLGALGSSTDIAAFAIVNGYVIYVLMMLVQAFCFSMQAISSFNMGARRYDRLIELVATGSLMQTAFMALVSGAVCLFPEAVCSLFTLDDPALAAASAPPVRMVVCLCAFGYLGQLLSSYFECIGAPVRAIICGCALYLIFTVPLVYIFGMFVGVGGVWLAQLVANPCTGLLACAFAAVELRRLRRLQEKAGT